VAASMFLFLWIILKDKLIPPPPEIVDLTPVQKKLVDLQISVDKLTPPPPQVGVGPPVTDIRKDAPPVADRPGQVGPPVIDVRKPRATDTPPLRKGVRAVTDTPPPRRQGAPPPRQGVPPPRQGVPPPRQGEGPPPPQGVDLTPVEKAGRVETYRLSRKKLF